MIEPGCRTTCFDRGMANDPQDEVDVTVDDELSDEVLGVVSGGAGGGMPKGPR
jgi:hypothetical protein